jgi:hypothetical protein
MMQRMDGKFDPRAWNLYAGLAVVAAAACGSRVASEDAGTGETSDAPECTSADDCPVGYGCYDGVCMYYPHHDGWVPYYDCYSDEECGEFEVCEYGYCESLGVPAPLCLDSGVMFPPPIPIDVVDALALSFADADADGQDELVVATATELVVFEVDGAPPIISAREPGMITDMVAGDFDAGPGEDLLLLVEDSLQLHSANGDGSFAPATTSSPPLGFVSGLIAAELDDLPPTDVLGWGGAGAYIDRGGDVVLLSEEQISAAALHAFATPEPSVALRRDSIIDFYLLDGQPLTMVTNILAGSPMLAAFARGPNLEYVNVVYVNGFSLVQARSVDLASQERVIYGTPERVFTGDLEADGIDELVYFDESTVAVEFAPFADGTCWHELPMSARGVPNDAVFGDHDGDGDEELAFRTTNGDVALFDGG